MNSLVRRLIDTHKHEHILERQMDGYKQKWKEELINIRCFCKSSMTLQKDQKNQYEMRETFIPHFDYNANAKTINMNCARNIFLRKTTHNERTSAFFLSSPLSFSPLPSLLSSSLFLSLALSHSLPLCSLSLSISRSIPSSSCSITFFFTSFSLYFHLMC